MTGQLPRVVILGTGGHAKVVIELIHAAGGHVIAGCTGQDATQGAPLGLPYLGGDEVLADLPARGIGHAFVAVGDNALRRTLATRASAFGFAWINAISPAAIISPTACLGVGIAVMSGAILNACVRVGDRVIVNTGAVIDHDCELGADCHIGPGCTLAGNCHVGAGAFVGAGSTLIPGVRIGENATVGAGAVVIDDIPAGAVVAGVPAKPLR